MVVSNFDYEDNMSSLTVYITEKSNLYTVETLMQKIIQPQYMFHCKKKTYARYY